MENMDAFLQFLSEYYLLIILGIIIIFVLAGIIIANYSYENFSDEFEKAKQTISGFNGSAVDLANFISYKKFNREISVNVFEKQPNTSNGSYVPAKKMVNISNELANSNSIASIAITSHEFGHACQHYENPKLLEKNYKLSKAVHILGLLNWPLFIIAVIMLFTDYFQFTLICLGMIILVFIFALTLKYLTIKIEKDASKRAIKLLQELELFSNKEINQVKKLLKSAKSTYIGDFFRALFSWTGMTHKTKIF